MSAYRDSDSSHSPDSYRVQHDWWRPEHKGLRHEGVYDTWQLLKQQQGPRYERLLHWARLYSSGAITDLRAFEGETNHREDTLRLNLTRSVIDAVHSKIIKNKVRCTFLTDGGDWSLQRKAKLLEQWSDGWYYEADVHKKAGIAFRDAEIFGTGVLKVAEEDGRVCCERVHIWDLYVDPVESVYGDPRTIYHHRLVDKGVLKELFHKHKDALQIVACAGPDDGVTHESLAEMVNVVESWHLPSKRGAKDGRHVICVEGLTLVDEEYGEPHFPFAIVRWADPVIGFWGDGLAEEVHPIAIELNEVSQKIQKALQGAACSYTFVEQGSIQKNHMTNSESTMVEYAPGTTPPTMIPVQPVHESYFRYQQQLAQWGYEFPGVSQLSAQSKKPSGLDSGAALREFNDIEAERFVPRGQEYERLFVDLTRMGLACARHLYSRGKDVAVKAVVRRRRQEFIRKIKWSEVALEEDSYELKVYPTSALPQSPAGRIQAAESFVKAGLLQPRDALLLLDFPDLQAVVSRELAPYEIVLDMMESILEDGEMIAPEPFMDLELTLSLGQATYLQAKINRAPEDRLDLLRRFNTATERLMAAAAPPPPGAPMGPMGAPPPAGPPAGPPAEPPPGQPPMN